MSAPAVTKWIYDFAEGSREVRELLGGKGSGIAEMTRVLGADIVPAGFTITTAACVSYVTCSPFRVPIARVAAAQAACQ
jgi:pyruvate, orthophosphate dikinase